MKILITGAKGMLGRTLFRRLDQHSLFPVDLAEMDIRSPGQIEEGFSSFQPEVVIHCAAMTDVDGCESRPLDAMELNGTASGNIAAACQKYNARLIAISTDYVFDGLKPCPYLEDDVTSPATEYGRSKLAGEKLIAKNCNNYLILRVAWLYGPGGPSFVHTISRLLKDQGVALKVVDDQQGNPTSTDAVASAIIDYLEAPELRGIVHCTCAGEASWYDFACKIKEILNYQREIVACTSEEFPRPAPRPKNSRLENRIRQLKGFPPMPHWKDSLNNFLKENRDEC